MIYSTETVLGIAEVLAADAAGNKQATMTDIDCAVNMLRSLAKERDHFKGMAEHRGRSIDNLLNTQGRMSTLNDQLLAAVERAFASLDQTDSSGDVGKWISEPVEILRAAISAAKGGTA